MATCSAASSIYSTLRVVEMLKTLKLKPWTCARCLSRHRRAGRGLTTAASATAHSPYENIQLPQVDNVAPGAKHDDRVLRQIFDSRDFWRDFSHRTRSNISGQTAGLFGNHYLKSQAGFEHFAQDTLRKCKKIVSKVLAASTVEEYQSMPRDLDRLSDFLCRVIDLSDFVRVTHPDWRIQAAATKAHAMMFEYMNVLNTTTGLNEQLQRALADPRATASWSEEEKIVARILLKDFANSAIDLPDEQRQNFVALSNDINQLGFDFVDQMEPAQSHLSFDSSKMKGIDPKVVQKLTRWAKVILPTVSPASHMALRTVEDEATRREIYLASRTASTQQIHRLEKLLKKRGELAQLSGYNSFAQMTLRDKMAKTPESVNQFLLALATDNAGPMQQELAELLKLKQLDAQQSGRPQHIQAWDREYYLARLRSKTRSTSRRPDFLSAYFSLGTVMQGLSRLFSRLYGVRFVPNETLPGETWNDDVRRLDIIDEQEGHIAVVYCDLFERTGKSPNPAHFTLRCSREIPDSEVAEAVTTPSHTPTSSTTPEQAANDGMATARRSTTNTLYQLPTIALICDFPLPSHPHRPTLLTFHQVQTLFHEMGHAIHSILGRTSLQNVSGTRCATDFAELPSILMEHFASSPEVLALFARHFETDAPLPYAMVADRLALDARGEAADTENQLLLALLDQRYHSALPLSPHFDSTRVYHDVWAAHASVPEPAETRWQGFFGHSVGYGATYYAYLFDRAIAGKVWREVFSRGDGGGAVDREKGQRFREEVLKWGGGREGWRCVAGVLGGEYAWLEEGGEEAMAEVGRWGVRG